mmetsp:Transcript_60807/g.131156  ORF Transcript_60807/g.131156 Transcript_60807/m.131156 type:complete len:305 (+) Transcript_60807:894-1808(+)
MRLALLLGCRLHPESALMVLSSGAHHLARLCGLATFHSTGAPGVHDPPRTVRGETLLHCQRRRKGRELIVLRASQGSVAYELALRLATNPRVAAIPGAPGRLADVLARDAVCALHSAHCSRALGGALRGGALAVARAQLLRAEHRAVGRMAVNLALGIVGPGTTGLAPWLFTIRRAVLIADRLRAVPGASRETRLGLPLHDSVVGHSTHSLGLTGTVILADNLIIVSRFEPSFTDAKQSKAQLRSVPIQCRRQVIAFWECRYQLVKVWAEILKLSICVNGDPCVPCRHRCHETSGSRAHGCLQV